MYDITKYSQFLLLSLQIPSNANQVSSYRITETSGFSDNWYIMYCGKQKAKDTSVIAIFLLYLNWYIRVKKQQ